MGVFYNYKIVKSGELVEVWKHSVPISGKSGLNEGTEKRSFDDLNAQEQLESIKRKQKYYNKKRWEIKRLVDENLDNNTKFFTLTFKENIQDIDIANREFKKFIQRLNRFVRVKMKWDYKYLATWEKQKRGAIHYHIILFNFPFVNAKKLEEIWGHGFIKINDISKVDKAQNVGRYVSKYFGKDLDVKEHKKKAYFSSRNLSKPVEINKFSEKDDIEIKNSIFQKEYSIKRIDNKGETFDDNVEYYVIPVDLFEWF